MSDIMDAISFARKAHIGQFRKYSEPKIPYISHPCKVMGYVAGRCDMGRDAIIAAVLHDVVEDTRYTLADIEERFGKSVASFVDELTNKSKQHPELNRAQRKQMDRERLAKASWTTHIIKMYDRLDNLLDIGKAEIGFIRLYCEESKLLLDVIGNTDPHLKQRVLQVISSLED